MSFGLIAAIVVVGGFAIWGLRLAFSKTREKGTESSSHHESGSGFNGY